MPDDSYTLVVILRSTNLRHFQLMLRTVQQQHRLPTVVHYVGLPTTSSALAQHAMRTPLPLDVQQQFLWCPHSGDDAHVNWRLFEMLMNTLETPVAIITESDVLLHREFGDSLTQVVHTSVLATSFPSVLSPSISESLDERAISQGEPFRSWGRILRDSVFGQSRAALRIAPLGHIGRVFDRLYVRPVLSSSAVAIARSAIEKLLLLKSEHSWMDERALFTRAGITYRRLTHSARHARLTEVRSQIFALVPPVTAWSSAPLDVLTVRPVLQRHRLN